MNKTILEMGICPRCAKALNLSHPDAVDFEGQRLHSECAAKARVPTNPQKITTSNSANGPSKLKSAHS